MFIVDTNVLVYSVNQSEPRHAPSRRWLERNLGGNETVGFAWMAVMGFLRITTNRRALPNPLTPAAAKGVMAAWLSAPAAVLIEPDARHFDRLTSLLESYDIRGGRISDAHLAALALERDAAVVTFDRNFEIFKELDVEKPS